MATTAQDALAALARASSDTGHVSRHMDAARPPVVTLARDYACGGEAIGAALAAALEVPYYDRELVEKIATAAHEDKSAMAMLDETDLDKWGLWLSSMFTGAKLHPSRYMRHLLNIVLWIGGTGGVIMGRGAHLILSEHGAFRVRLVGSVKRCAARLAEEAGLDPATAEARVRQMNDKRARFVLDHFHTRIDEPTSYDLVVNTDGYEEPARVAEFLAAAWKAHAASRGRVGPRGVSAMA